MTNVLFLCTGNSARSILAECLLNRLGAGRFVAYSAGSHPAGAVNPHALELLQARGFEVTGLRSKSWDEFAADDAPRMGLVVTVCDNAAGEVCPLWHGAPASAHWSFRDPAAFRGSAAGIAAEFAEVAGQIESRVRRLVDLPTDTLDQAALQNRVRELAPD